MQPLGALQYLKYYTLYLTITWQFKAQSYITPVCMDMFHLPHLLCLQCATESTGLQMNYLAVKVRKVCSSEMSVHVISVLLSKYYYPVPDRTGYCFRWICLFVCIFICFFLCFFVSKITRKRLDRFAWNFQGMCGVTMGRPGYIFDQFRETARCLDAQHGDGVCCAFATQLVVIITIIIIINDVTRKCSQSATTARPPC